MRFCHCHLAFLAALALCLPGCSNDDMPDAMIPQQETALSATLTLTAKSVGSFGAQSRWEPSKENAVCNEGKIEDVLVFIYDKTLQSASSSDKPLQIEYLSVSQTSTLNGEKVYTTSTFKLSDALTAGNYYVFVIANPDYRTPSEGGPNCNKDYFLDNKSLVDIRSYVYTGALYRDLSDGTNLPSYDRFIMSSDDERSFTITDDDITNKATISLSKKTDGTETPIVVERLAARIDVSFGKPIDYGSGGVITSNGSEYKDTSGNMVTFTGGEPSAAVASISLPVYDYESYIADGSLVYTYNTYKITDIDVLNVVSDKQLLIQKKNGVYFPNDSWQHKVAANSVSTQTVNGVEVPWAGWYSDYSTAQAENVNKTVTEDHSLSALIKGINNLYTDSEGNRFYTIGYYRENINNKTGATTIDDIKDGKTTVRITGSFEKASDLNSAASSTPHNIDFTIMHCKLDDGTPYPRIEGAMSYAIGRNTIYRLCIDKILTDSDNVYVIWYYDSDNDGTYNPYATSTPFGETILDKNTTPVD